MCNPKEVKPTYHLYVFVRKDLPTKEQIAVQACHAAIESARYHIPPNAEHPSLVILQVTDEQELEVVSLYLDRIGIRFKGFREEWFNDSLTAIATEMISGEQRKHLRHFQLLNLKE